LTEWCADPWHDNYKDAPKTSGAWAGGDEKHRVARGGSWKDKPDRCTSRFREKLASDTLDDAVGLRCVLSNETK
jgi:formylglycine-generating enzyme required for sulfatase activity